MRQVERTRMRRGFTLIEAMLTTVIVGTGELAIVGAQQAYHQKNAWAQRTSTALLLANEVRELTLDLPMHDPMEGTTEPNLGPEANESGYLDYDDLDDFAGPIDAATRTGSGLLIDPPINALGQEMAQLTGWSQFVTVETVDLRDINNTVNLIALDDMTDDAEMARIRVAVRYEGPNDDKASTITTLTWFIPK